MPLPSGTLDRVSLLAALNQAKQIVSKKTTIPVMSYVMIRRGPVLVANDLDVIIELPLKGKWAGDDVLVDPYELSSILKVSKAEKIKIKGSLEKKDAKVKTPSARVLAITLDDVEVEMRSIMDAADYPTNGLDETVIGYLDFDAAPLLAGFARVKHAISDEETRYYLNGVHMLPRDGKFLLTATDGHRMARHFVEASETDANIENAISAEAGGVIVPRQAVNLLPSLFGKINGPLRIAFSGVKVEDTVALEAFKREEAEYGPALDENGQPAKRPRPRHISARMIFSADDIVMSTKVIDGTFPEADRVIPKEDQQECLVIEQADMVAALAKLPPPPKPSRTGPSTNPSLSLDLVKTEIVMVVKVGESTVKTKVAKVRGKMAGFGVRLDYLLDALRFAGPGQIEIRTIDAASPITLRKQGDDGLAIVMPMRR
jgi:DNA polymerase-3 subunit beta